MFFHFIIFKFQFLSKPLTATGKVFKDYKEQCKQTKPNNPFEYFEMTNSEFQWSAKVSFSSIIPSPLASYFLFRTFVATLSQCSRCTVRCKR